MESVIGLEFHVQLARKLLSRGPLSLFDIATPGSLPILDKRCLIDGIRAGLSLNCRINKKSTFDRKHYFYHDIPNGYQITQKFHPIASSGYLYTDTNKRIGIQQIQLEQDTAKSVVDIVNAREAVSLDYTRSGMGLIEIITDPDIRSAEEAGALVKQVQAIVRAVDISEASMDEGSLRVDVNVSVRKEGSSEMGVRCEIKNMSSIRHIQKAVEVRRQVALISDGHTVDATTRGYDQERDLTFELRSKETLNDYRYMPDPDLKNVFVSEELVNYLRDTLPELPNAKIRRFISDYNLSDIQARILVETPMAESLFETTLTTTYTHPTHSSKSFPKNRRNPSSAASLIINTLFGELTSQEISLETCLKQNMLTPNQIASLLDALDEKRIVMHQVKPLLSKWISSKSHETAFHELLASKKSSVVGFMEVDDMKITLRNLIQQNPSALDDLLGVVRTGGAIRKREPKVEVFTFFAGQLMRMIKGRADAEGMRRALHSVLVDEKGVKTEVFEKWKQIEVGKKCKRGTK